MLAKDLITNTIPSLSPNDTFQQGLDWMTDFHLRHLPIVQEYSYFGLLTEEVALNVHDPYESVSPPNALLEYPNPFIQAEHHIYDVLRMIHESHLSAIPVLDNEGCYVGLITAENLLAYFATEGSITQSGGILVLAMDYRNYALSQIARIVESESASILSSYISSLAGSLELEVTLKLNKKDLQHIIATFERFNFTIKAAFQEEEYTETLRDRYESLISYLNV